MTERETRYRAIILLGPTASGKTPLGEFIASQGIDGRKYFHFDFGNELRALAALESGNGIYTNDEIGYIKGVLEAGLLLEDEHFYLAKKIFHSFIVRKRCERNDIIVLNGLPRHRGQGEDMEDAVDVSMVVVLSCSARHVRCRIRGNTGGDRTGREDDDHEVVRRKIETYHRRTAPLISFYGDRGADIIRIEVTPRSDAQTVFHEFMSKNKTRLLNIQ